MSAISNPWPKKEPFVAGIGTGGTANMDEGVRKAVSDPLVKLPGGGGGGEMRPRGVVESPQDKS